MTSMSGNRYDIDNVSSRASSDQGAGDAGADRQAGREEDDLDVLLDQQRTLEESVFSCMAMLNKSNKRSSWRLTALQVAIEFLQIFLLLFNDTTGWGFDFSATLYEILSYVLFRIPFSNWSYSLYLVLVYLMLSMALIWVGVTTWLGMLLRRDDQSLSKRETLVKTTQLVGEWLFGIFAVSVIDMMAEMIDCNISSDDNMNKLYPDIACFQMPHLAHIGASIIGILVVGAGSVFLAVATCDLNPASKGFNSSPAALVRAKVAICKVLLVLVIDILDDYPVPRGLLAIGLLAVITWQDLSAMPYYRDFVNHLYTAYWATMTYLACWWFMVLINTSMSTDRGEYITKVVLSTLVPVFIGCYGLSYLRLWYAKRPLAKFLAAPPDATLKSIHRFRSVNAVGLVSRVVRRWDEEGVLVPAAADMGEKIIQAGLAVFPHDASLQIMYSSFQLHVRNDGPSARTHLQAAVKAGPALLDRYFVYVIQEAIKDFHVTQQGGMDLAAYIEWQRTYKFAVRAHKCALMAQRKFWARLSSSSRLYFSDLQNSLATVERLKAKAKQVYKSALDRYPGNGKLLLAYAKFLDDVDNDAGAAEQALVEAERAGDEQTFNVASLAGVNNTSALLSRVDDRADAVIITDYLGTILLVNTNLLSMFGYGKGELEGSNVTCLMPPPFSSNHPQYLRNYLQTGQRHVLEKMTSQVVLHKERYLLPVKLGIVHVSGAGEDTVFMGIFQAHDMDPNELRFTVMPATHVVLHADGAMSDWLGKSPAEAVGRVFETLLESHAARQDMQAVVEGALSADLEGNTVDDSGVVRTWRTKLQHKYIEPLEVDIAVRLAGTPSARLLTLVARRVQVDSDMLMVVNRKGQLMYATQHLALMLGYKQLDKLQLSDLLPAPFAQLHPGWMKALPVKVPPASCRAGRVVQMLTATGVQVPVRLQIRSNEEGEGACHIIKVAPVPADAELHDRCVRLRVSAQGIVESVEGNMHALFGVADGDVRGACVSQFINVFETCQWQLAAVNDGATTFETVMGMLAEKTELNPQISWRVGVHRIKPRDGGLPQLSRTGSSAFTCKDRNADKPAIMQVVLDGPSDGLQGTSMNGAMKDDEQSVGLQLLLWSPDVMTGVLEIDGHMRISKADNMAALMLGRSSFELKRVRLAKLLQLNGDKQLHDMLGSSLNASHGLLRWRLGTTQKVAATHVDGAALTVELQVVSSKTHLNGFRATAKLGLMNASSGNGQAFWKALTAEVEDGAAAGFNSINDLHDAASVASDGGSDDGQPRGRLGANTKRQQAAPVHSALDDGATVGATTAPRLRLAAAVGDGDGDGQEESQRGHSPAASSHSSSKSSRPRSSSPASSERSQGIRTSAALVAPTDQRTINWVQSAAQGKGVDGDEAVMHPSDGVAAVRITANGRTRVDGSKLATGGAKACCVAQPVARDARKDQLGASLNGSPVAADQKPGRSVKLGRSPSMKSGQEADGESDGTSMVDGVGVAAAADGPVHGADFRRAKRLRQLKRLLTGSAAMAPLQRLVVRTVLLLFVMMAVHCSFFAVLSTQLDAQHQYVVELNGLGHAADDLTRIALKAAQIWGCYQPSSKNATACTKAKQSTNIAQLVGLLPDFRYYHVGSYLGYQGLRQPEDSALVTLWTNPGLTTTEVSDANPGMLQYTYDNNSLSSLGDSYMVAATELTYNIIPTYTSKTNTSRFYSYVMINGPGNLTTGYRLAMDLLTEHTNSNIGSLRNMLVILMVMEALVVNVIGIVYQLVLLSKAHGRDLDVMMLLVGLPGGLLRTMSTLPMEVGDDEEDAAGRGDMDDTGSDTNGKDTSLRALSTAKSVRIDPTIKGSSNGIRTHSTESLKLTWTTIARWLGSDSRRFKANGRRLLRDKRVAGYLLVPFTLWQLVVLALYSASLVQLGSVQYSVNALDIAQHIVFRSSRVRLWSALLVFMPTSQAPVYRRLLLEETALFNADWQVVINGGTFTDVMPGHMPLQVQSQAYQSPAHAELFFTTTACLRANQSTCLPPSDPNYEITHSGLNAMINQFIQMANLLAGDPVSALGPSNARYDYIWRIAPNDMYDALLQTAALFASSAIAEYDGVKMLHVVLLSVTLALMPAYFLLALRPYRARVQRHTMTIAELMSHLPADSNIEKSVRELLQRDSSAAAHVGKPERG